MTTQTHDSKPKVAVADRHSPEVSIVIPCLNEAETLEVVIREVQGAIAQNRLSAEIVIADNGSKDGSQEIAERLGARVVAVVEKGYGSALRGGIAAARGNFIVMGDADGSYEFSAIGKFIAKLREGNELVMGNRFQGGIQAGAMPPLNQHFGNPLLTALVRLFFHKGVGDVNCGLRAFTKAAFAKMNLQTTGMEFATEMPIKALIMRLKIAEVPTILRPDGRSRPPHMRPWRDGWRNLRFMLVYTPGWLFMLPGVVLFVIGLLGSLLLVGGDLHVGAIALSIHTMLVLSFLMIVGYQLIVFAVSTRFFATRAGLLPESAAYVRLYPYVNLETGVIAGAIATLIGLAGIVLAFWSWHSAGLGRLDPYVTMRQLIPAVVLVALGTETVFASFFLSIMGMGRSERIHAHEVKPENP
ncbi:MAG: glycosyltransferase family 2 protein [Candidatus Dormibacteraceae bacterium]